MRALVPLLIVANGLALAWWQGWIDPWAGSERQPERLERQIKPETMQILPRERGPGTPGRGGAALGGAALGVAAPAERAPAAAEEVQSASAPVIPAAPASNPVETVISCVLVPASDEVQAEGLGRRLAAAGVSFERVPTGATQGFVVYEPARATDAETRSRVEELQRGGVRDIYVLQGGPYRLGISLGYFRSEATARQLLAQLAAKGFTGAQIGEVKSEPGPLLLRASGPAAAIGDALSGLPATPGQGVRPCD